MNWTECQVHTTQEASEAVANLLIEQGSNGVVVEDASDRKNQQARESDEIGQPMTEHLPNEGVVLKAYFPADEVLAQRMESVRLRLDDLRHRSGWEVGSISISTAEVKEEDWAQAWKKYYKPVQVSPTLTIAPSWEDYQPKQGETVIELDPGMAFGTGTHPTTLLCLQALERIVHNHNKVIDIGTGSGILSIAAAKFGAASVYAYDNDAVAVRVANENMRINNVNNRVSIVESDLFSNTEEKADIVVANLLADIIIRMAPSVQTHLRPAGYLLVSGIIQNKKEDVREALEQEGFTVAEVLEMEDWVALLLKVS
ncbi:ribosomal protein L11 methyltransferase [Geomicrobium halophilum]|uniref:Ribosomal protein L11 methyltransferase n=1 Tax=Geomicrobium halophilum TaxID=549000 RepID=A0A841PWT7_9BACL|nr:ribosomal protein L11 methyltransferase [Geomicrobium halophilum]